MAYVTRQSTQTVTKGTELEPAATEPIIQNAYVGVPIITRVIYLIGGIIIALLGFRFLLALLGANRDNAFASFIYGVSHPFVAPFFGLFNYREQIGVVRFEVETLVAIAFWAFVTWGLARLSLLATRNNYDRNL